MGEAHRQSGFSHKQLQEPDISHPLRPQPFHDEPFLDSSRMPSREKNVCHPAAAEPSIQLVASHGVRHHRHHSLWLTLAPNHPKLIGLKRLVLFAVLLTMPSVTWSAPRADVVMVWSPGSPVAPLETVARHRGAALIDRSPVPQPNPETARFLQRGISAYEAIQLGEAQAALDQARDLADKTGAQGLTRAQLSDLFLYRGLVRAANGDEATAWDELVTAMVIHPTRSLDPTQYAPKIQSLVKRVRDDVLQKRPQAKIVVEAPSGCLIYIDGELVGGPVLRATGPHFARVTCNGHEPWASRVDLTSLDSHVAASPKPYQPPSDGELLIQARAAGVRAIAAVEVHGRIATVRLIGVDGKERERRSTAVANNDLTQLAAILDEVLAPPAQMSRPWLRSRWAWAIGAAVATAAIVIPITAVIASDTGAATWTVRVRGLP